jgi:signal transduction histidine kinase
MEQAKKMEVIGRLTAGVAHDFNNLLTIISGNIERLEGQGSDGAKIEAALSATARGGALIRKMLTFAHRHSCDQEAADINAVLTSFFPLLRAALRSNIIVEFNLAPGPMICRIDRAEFDFAILNIVSNSGHAMPSGGRLKIDTGTVLLGGNQNEPDLPPGEYVRIAVIDSGQGMSSDVAALAFEQFFTTRERGTGTGLGLSQVYGFAKQAGGLATLESTVGVGTTVTIYFPKVAEVGAIHGEGELVTA